MRLPESSFADFSATGALGSSTVSFFFCSARCQNQIKYEQVQGNRIFHSDNLKNGDKWDSLSKADSGYYLKII